MCNVHWKYFGSEIYYCNLLSEKTARLQDMRCISLWKSAEFCWKISNETLAELLKKSDQCAHANELQMGEAIALEAKPITRNSVIT